MVQSIAGVIVLWSDHGYRPFGHGIILVNVSNFNIKCLLRGIKKMASGSPGDICKQDKMVASMIKCVGL